MEDESGCNRAQLNNPQGLRYVIQQSPSARANCSGCKQRIGLGSVRYALWVRHQEIWRYWHVHCVSAAMIETALENGEFGTVAEIPTMAKPGQDMLSPERRDECNKLLSCVLNGQQKDPEVVRRLQANPDQCVLDLIDVAKSRRIPIPGRKKGDKFDATKAAIESVRDTATGSFDVDEALDALEAAKKPRAQDKIKKKSKQKPKKTWLEVRGGDGGGGGGGGKKRARGKPTAQNIDRSINRSIDSPDDAPSPTGKEEGKAKPFSCKRMRKSSTSISTSTSTSTSRRTSRSTADAEDGSQQPTPKPRDHVIQRR